MNLKEMKEVLEKNYLPLYHPFLPYKVLYLGTCDKDKNPNLTVISFAKVINEKTIAIPNIALLKSIKNIEENPNVTLVSHIYKKFEFYGPWYLRPINFITKNIIKELPTSFFGLIKFKILIFLYSYFLRFFLPRLPYKILPCEEKFYEFRGKAKIVKYGSIYEKMNNFIKAALGKDFNLESVVIIEIEEIREWSRK
ncbi:MAG: pyridoxamine 5'-phosphate oxidase family protein [Candidatus Aenigmatarchaeota archaeon]